jgi:hypothetical protein
MTDRNASGGDSNLPPQDIAGKQPLPALTNTSQLTNDQLAAQFFDVVSRTSKNVRVLPEMRKLVANCLIPIAEGFQRDGSLQNTKIPKFHHKYYPVLERILRDGVQATS